MRLIDADYLKTWFGEKDLYAYDYIIGTIDDAPTVEPQTRCIAKIEINKEDLENLVEEKVLDIKKAMSNTSNALKPLDKAEERWIPCSERLPDTNGVYNVTRKISDGFVCRNISDTCYYDGSNTWHDDTRVNHERRYITDVIAWMPLPEPYGGEQE